MEGGMPGGRIRSLEREILVVWPWAFEVATLPG